MVDSLIFFWSYYPKKSNFRISIPHPLLLIKIFSGFHKSFSLLRRCKTKPNFLFKFIFLHFPKIQIFTFPFNSLFHHFSINFNHLASIHLFSFSNLNTLDQHSNNYSTDSTASSAINSICLSIKSLAHAVFVLAISLFTSFRIFGPVTLSRKHSPLESQCSITRKKNSESRSTELQQLRIH